MYSRSAVGMCLLAGLGLAISPLTHAGQNVDWNYHGAIGPANWARLSPEYASCDGANQSPINLTGFLESDLPAIEFDYKAGGEEIEYNHYPETILHTGHTVEVEYQEGSSMTVDGIRFELVQFHFHAPSENHINGKSYPMEGHLVHSDGDGHLAVVAVMFEIGASNDAIALAWDKLPERKGEETDFDGFFDVNRILPEGREYYRFNGSLTTPPCSEGVRWFVLKHPVTVSQEQVSELEKVLQHSNNRPIQDVNARVILQ